MNVPQIAQVTERIGITGATGGGLWAVLAENAQAIGAACALVGVLIGLIGLAVNTYYQHKRSKGPPA